jgi:WD40 repeat protein
LNEFQTENIRKWSNDASRFIKLYGNSIRENPLTVYHTFAFSPRSSIFHQVYSKMESFPHPVVTMGLDDDWPSNIMAETYDVYTHCLSPSEDTFITGGERGGLAVYSVWDTRTADGKTFVHPCKTPKCRVRHVSLDHCEMNVVLRTGCECGKLYRWNISSDHHSLVEQVQLGSTGPYWWWAGDGSKAVSKIKIDGKFKKGDNHQLVVKDAKNERTTLYRLSISGNPPVCYILLKSRRDTHWWFSPGHGDKVIGADEKGLALWKCSSGRQIFRKSYAFEEPPPVCFSPYGTMIACVGSGMTELISTEDGAVLRSWDGIGNADGIQFFPKGDKFSIINFGVVHLFEGDVVKKKEIERNALFISPDGQRVAVTSEDGVNIFNHTLDEKLECHELGLLDVYNCLVSWVHSILISIGNDTISFHHLSHNPQPILSTHELPPLWKLLLSPDDRHLLALYGDLSIHVWDLESGQLLNSPDDQIPDFCRSVRMEYAPNSSRVLLWDEKQIIVLEYSAGWIEWNSVIPCSSSKLLAVTFFPDSNRILVIDMDSNVTIISLRDMSRYSMPPLLSRLNKIRKLVISPTEQLIAICSDSGLIIHGTCQDIDRAPLLSDSVQSAIFSPDGIYLYTVEMSFTRWMISRVDTRNRTIHRVLPGSSSHFFFSQNSVNYRSYLAKIDITIANGQPALRFSTRGYHGYVTIFLDLFTNRRIVPPSPILENFQLRYKDQWLMTLPTKYASSAVMSQDHLAYIGPGKPFILDYSSLIKQM